MEPQTSVIDKFHSFAKSSGELFNNLISRSTNRPCQNPIEILKRLQRETFSDLMKLRDRQEKIERILAFYKSSKGSPFQEASTHIKGVVNVVGSLLFVDGIDQHICNILDIAGVRTGINSTFIFDTIVRHKDALVAEFVARHNSHDYQGDVLGTPLALKKVKYVANINDSYSAIAIPLGAQCKDFGIDSTPVQNQGLTGFSSFLPPLFYQCHGCAAGLMMKGTNVTTSVAELLSWLTPQPNFVGTKCCLSTFAQVTYQPVSGTKLTLLGLHQMPMLRAQNIQLDFLTIPISSFKFRGSSNSSVETSSPSITRNSADNAATGSVALMLDSELDESSRIGGWVELQRSNTKNLQWAVSLSDTPDDELGWGLSIGGVIQQRPLTAVHLQLETFLKFNFGNRFNFQPGLVYVVKGKHQVPALMFRSSWFL